MFSTIKKLLLTLFLFITLSLINECRPKQPNVRSDRPNVLFIAVDDLNDWIEPLGGHPQAKTPNMSRLANQGMNFTKNYCVSPGCGPSRAALLTGRASYRSGLYSNYQYFREVMPDDITLPKYFSDNGYWSAGAGKIFHNNMPDPDSWDDYFPSKEKHMPNQVMPAPPQERPLSMPNFDYLYKDFDWYPLTDDQGNSLPDEKTGDYSSVEWISNQLKKEHTKPFFLACGIYRPHVPWYVPKKYFDMYPLDSIILPKVKTDDLDDLGERAIELVERGGNYHKKIIASNNWKNAVQGYLASISFADAMVGKLLDALEESRYADNTIVVLWSDHGWQLGEKQHWRKFAIWDNVARTVLMIKSPKGMPGLPNGISPLQTCNRVTSLLDLFPTLIELCGLPPKDGLDGRSLLPLLSNPESKWDYPAITTYDFNEFSIKTENYRYIKYIDGSEELYDHRNDPEEWTNLARDPGFSETKELMSSYIPKNPAPFVKTSYKIMDHHIKPYATVEEYENRKSTKSFQLWAKRNRE